MTIPTITLNDGTTIPQLGFGTLNIPPDRTPSRGNTEKTAEIVGTALRLGYRHIDSAQMYGNEQGVGEAIAASGILREQLFITSKLGNGNHRPEDVRRSFDESLGKLGLDYLDLFLIHWPLPTLYDGDYVSSWKAMTELVAEGRLRSAGVSNFQPEHLDRIIGATGVPPAVNQIEAHPYFLNDTARASSSMTPRSAESPPITTRRRPRSSSPGTFGKGTSSSPSRCAPSGWRRTLRSSTSRYRPTRSRRSARSTEAKQDESARTPTPSTGSLRSASDRS